MRPSRSSAAEFITDLPVSASAGVTRPQITAMPRVSAAICSTVVAIARDKRRPFHQIARRVAADRKFRKQNQTGAARSAPAGQTE